MEQRREASHSFSYEIWFNLRVRPSKRDDHTLMRRTPQQKVALCWCRSTFSSRLVTRMKLLTALLPSVASRTKKKAGGLVLSHCPITHDLFLPRDCQIFNELGELVFLAHLKFCRCQTLIHRATSKDILRGETSSGWCRHEDVSHAGPYCEGTT